MRSSPNSTDPVCYTKEEIRVGERKWNGFLPLRSFDGDSLKAEISELVMRVQCCDDQDEREMDGAVHWNSMDPKLRNAFQKYGGREFLDTDWLQHLFHGSSKMRFQYCVNSQNSLLYIRAIQGHTGGEFDSA